MRLFIQTFLVSIIGLMSAYAQTRTVPRVWNEENLGAIRIDFPAPTVHARNLFFLSVAMHDAWAAFDTEAIGYLHNEDYTFTGTYETEEEQAEALGEARDEAMSYAAFTVLSHMYSYSTHSAASLAAFRNRHTRLGYDPDYTDTTGTGLADLGNRVAAAILAYSETDGAEQSVYPGYTNPDTDYAAINSPLILSANDTSLGFPMGWNDMNRWQPLSFDIATTQNGQAAQKVQTFVSPHWGSVLAFGLGSTDLNENGLYFDPGDPPYLGSDTDLEYKANALEVLQYSALLDPDAGAYIDASPASRGNNTLGFNDGVGRALNPYTGQPYETNIVNHADYGRCLAEFWADGPESETPPGHWNVLANEVSDELELDEDRGLLFEGQGDPLERREWDVKLYLALNAALHNTAVAVWGIKEHYDYVRPVSAIRYMSKLGQSTHSSLPNYNSSGIPLSAGLVELIDAATTATGQKHEHLAGHEGEIAVNTWPGKPADPETESGGRGWILGAEWLPYQQDTFVTPAFAGYVSGHSGFSRAAAEVLTAFTGDEYFPGGIHTYTVPAGGLHFEYAPSADTTLQWATYYDAADEAGISRIYGGIHVSPDDGPGRIVGSSVGIAAFQHAKSFWNQEILSKTKGHISVEGDTCVLQFDNCISGYQYELKSSTTLVDNFPTTVLEAQTATSPSMEFTQSVSEDRCFYRLDCVEE